MQVVKLPNIVHEPDPNCKACHGTGVDVFLNIPCRCSKYRKYAIRELMKLHKEDK